VEKLISSQVRARVRFSGIERSALAAALIVGIVLITAIHAPIGPVLAGCSLAFAGIVVNVWRKNR
jgi:hypothetical protein